MDRQTFTHRFSPGIHALAEYHSLIFPSDPALDFTGQMASVLEAAEEASAGLTVHFRRFFLSDAANQQLLLEAALSRLSPAPASIVQQAPLDGSRIVLWQYATDPMDTYGGTPAHNGYRHCWTGSLKADGKDSMAQTACIFQALERRFSRQGLSVARDAVRTWIFVRDVDANYSGMVQGRREYFDSIGLTSGTHYIASTGIEGRTADSRDMVELDAYAVDGLQEGQIQYLYAAEYLSRTSVYGVTFERGTAVSYGDRRHVFISGTASIDVQGQVLHTGDAGAQASRMLQNVEALMAEAGAGLEDIAMAIVYLRDPADFRIVKEKVSAACPEGRMLYVHAPVCRPSWLVEMECIGLVSAVTPGFRDF